jgi:hypothetical protein
MLGFTAAETTPYCADPSQIYEDRAAECSRAAQQTDDPVFRRLLLMLASQWKLAAQEEAPPWTSTSGGASGLPQSK